MSATTADSLDLLRNKYLKQLESKQSEIVAIQHKLAVLDELKKEAETLSLFGSEPVSLPMRSIIPPRKNDGLTESMMAAIPSFYGKAFSAPEMRDRLLECGYRITGAEENFIMAVGTTLSRLVEKDDAPIVKENLNGKTVYRAKPR